MTNTEPSEGAAPPSADEAAQALVDAARQMAAAGLNSGTSGNMSVRRGGGMLITPTGIEPERLAPEMMVAMDLDGRRAPDGAQYAPSSEWALHAAVYRAFGPAGAVVHAHPDAAVALSCLRENLPAFHYMVASFGGADVRCARYATFGTTALADAAVEALEGRTACLLANHGTICHAAGLADALAATQRLETLARQYMMVRAAGSPALLDAAEMARVAERYRTYGQA